jgi:hypothetical protein
MPVGDEIAGLEPSPGSHRRAILDRLAELGRQLQHRRSGTREVDLYRHVTGRRRLHERGRHAPFRDEQECRADRGVAGERQLAVGREDAHVVAVVAHRRHERRLRERDLARDREHRVGIEALGHLGHHAELIARERFVGEHVEQSEGHPHGVAVSQPGVLLGLTDVLRTLAGVAQWQSSSLPSWLCGFDSRHPLRHAEGAAPQDRPFGRDRSLRREPAASTAAPTCPRTPRRAHGRWHRRTRGSGRRAASAGSGRSRSRCPCRSSWPGRPTR